MRLVVAFLMVIGFAMPGLAQERTSLWPQVPAATGKPHPEGNEVMRRQHMEMMKHDRDLTMYDGKRPVEASLAACFDCHAVKDEAGTPVTYADDRHFCRVCHDYAAVKVDCFMCHRSTPEGVEEPPAHARNRGGADASGIRAYLKGLLPKGGPVLAQSDEVMQ